MCAGISHISRKASHIASVWQCHIRTCWYTISTDQQVILFVLFFFYFCIFSFTRIASAAIPMWQWGIEILPSSWKYSNGRNFLKIEHNISNAIFEDWHTSGFGNSAKSIRSALFCVVALDTLPKSSASSSSSIPNENFCFYLRYELSKLPPCKTCSSEDLMILKDEKL